MTKNLEKDLVNYLYFELNKENFLLRDEIFEYDVQFKVHEFLKHRFQNGNHAVTREKNKVDHVIENKDENRNPINETFIEVKTFIKSSERLCYKKISDDLLKLKNAQLKNSLNEYYFLFVVKESHFNNKSPQYITLIECCNNSKLKTYTFDIGSQKIKTRIIRSFVTSFDKKVDNSAKDIPPIYIRKFHRNQIRVFLFQLI